MTIRLTLAAALLAAAGAVCADAQPITLNSVHIDTSRRVDAKALAGSETLLLQFAGPIDRDQRRALEAATDRIYAYLPPNAFLVRMPMAQRAQRLAEIGARWSGAWAADYKIARGVREAARDGDAQRPRQLMLQLLPDQDLDATLARLRELGVPGLGAAGKGGHFSRLRLTWTGEDIATWADRVAALPEVFWLDLEPRRALLNDTTIWVGQSGVSGGMTTPIFDRGLHGEGQIVAVLDTGIDPDMCWFRDTTLGLPPTNACNGGTATNAAQRKLLGVNFLATGECSSGIGNNEWDTQDHGTHVAGTVAGDNVGRRPRSW
jgi:hypothetical protein